jgi:DNA-binding response OmpR family regulator
MKKILLAEHDSFLINVYANELRKSGYSTSIAQDGEIAISRIKNINPDLLILEAGLPKIDGFSVLKILREEMGFKELKVVMLSNFNQEEEVRKSSELGVDKYFTKANNTPEEIVNEIKRILS